MREEQRKQWSERVQDRMHLLNKERQEELRSKLLDQMREQ